ncbi:hypothetical protein [Paludibacterium denitrificans]|uniref:Uncharacterized protein n=1 Tax=Paludibacterium denitrificans TaxID=2675226 RepID=A0A844GFD4_9NEIS|nr:hypothetical protein [Paludibacterium denitrificans]MTD33607.1 hypothetical protein [Paludibacterium denitrificans]
MTNESAERAQEWELKKELGDVSHALNKLRPTVSIMVVVGKRTARVDVYRARPCGPEVLQDALRKLDVLEGRYAAELALPVVGWRARMANWWYRKRLKKLSHDADVLLQLVTGEQALFITYHDMLKH